MEEKIAESTFKGKREAASHGLRQPAKCECEEERRVFSAPASAPAKTERRGRRGRRQATPTRYSHGHPSSPPPPTLLPTPGAHRLHNPRGPWPTPLLDRRLRDRRKAPPTKTCPMSSSKHPRKSRLSLPSTP